MPDVDGARPRLGGLLTTGDVARLLRVAPRTVQNRHDAGELEGFRVPGSAARRFDPAAVARYCRANGLPTPPALEPRGVLLVGAAAGVAAALPVGELPAPVLSAADAYEAGRLAATCHPRAALIDAAGVGRGVALRVGRDLAALRPGVVLVGVLTEDDGDEAAWRAAGFGALLRHPAAGGAAAALLRGEAC
jgi:hypothetical protein